MGVGGGEVVGVALERGEQGGDFGAKMDRNGVVLTKI
jgi:hypothetical protein